MQTQTGPNVLFSEAAQAQPAHVDWVAFLTGEILATGLLSRTLYDYPTHEWLQTLATEDIFSEAPLGETQPDVQGGLTLLQAWTQSASGGLSKGAVDDIGADYTRLMIGPDIVLAPPWESVYFSEERMVFSTQTTEVRDWYRRFGLKVEHPFQEPDDHIGLELAFVAHLAREALVALEQGQPAVFERLIASQREFLSKHLLNWSLDWCNLAHQHAHTDFFRGLALLTRGTLLEIGSVLKVEVAVTAKDKG